MDLKGILKNRGKFGAAGMLCFTLLGTNGYGQNSVTFNVGEPIAVVEQEVFGLLMEVTLGRQWKGNGSIFMGQKSLNNNEATFGMRTSVIEAFKECGVGAVQFPGGCAANGYEWDRSLNPSNVVGVDQFIEFCKLTGAEAMISGKPTGSDAAQNLAFAKYIIETLDYPLKWFKIGNEIWGGCGTNYTNGYTNGFKTNVDRFKDLMATEKGKNLKFIAAANAMEGNYSWIPTWYNDIGDVVDAIEYHDYIYYPNDISSSNPTTSNYWTIMNSVFVGDFHDHLVNQIVPRMKQADPTNKVKACVDEWGDWLKGDNWMQTITVMDAISAGGHLNQLIQNADVVGAACLAQGVNCIHSIVNISESGQMVITPAGYVFKLYKPHHANNAKALPVTSSSFEKANGNVPAVSTVATIDDNGTVNISFTNCDLSNNRNVKVTLNNLQGNYSVLSAEVVTGPQYTSTNPFGGAEVVNIKPLDESAVSLDNNEVNVTLPSKSVVMVRLDRPDALNSRQIKNKGADAFSIRAGSHGVIITSMKELASPVTVTLYRLDGKTVLESGNFMSGKTCTLGKNITGTGVFLVKITGPEVNLSQQVVLAK
ncbi:MAG: hypothetical protein JW863_14090 [Chitinispirillaceae bacterium]|nr:hypothetical protein [Chitinispirillaceae bacterium]